MPVDVQPGISEQSTEVKDLQKILSSHVLPDIITVSGIPAGQEVLVNCRLNETADNNPAPVWYGWVLRSGNNPPAGLIGTTHLSPIYKRTFNNATQVQNIDYSQPNAQQTEKQDDDRPNPRHKRAFSHDMSLGLNWRRFACIKAGGRRAGTLTVGFTTPPQNAQAAEQALTDWAKGNSAKTQLVSFLTATFNPWQRNHP